MQSISYENWQAVTLSQQFIVLSIILFAVPLILYLLTSAFVRGRSSSGRSSTKPMLFYRNTWLAVLIYTVLGGIIYTFTIVYPVWILIFGGSQ